jgi:hypothetical protein
MTSLATSRGENRGLVRFARTRFGRDEEIDFVVVPIGFLLLGKPTTLLAKIRPARSGSLVAHPVRVDEMKREEKKTWHE